MIYLRVISGKYKGKNLLGFDVLGTRPTMDRVKESMFGIIQSRIKDSICLDLFAGSGSLGIEALSNGARECYFVEKNNEIYDLLKKNLIGVDGNILIKSDYKDALISFVKKNIKFDIIFLDPPYKLCLINDILDFIFMNNLLNDDGIVVCEYEVEKVLSNKFEELKTKKYGSKMVTFYRKL